MVCAPPRTSSSSIPGCSRSLTPTYVDIALSIVVLNLQSLLVPDCSSVVASICAAQPLTGLLVNGDTFAITPVAREIQLMTSDGKQPDRVRRESHLFH